MSRLKGVSISLMLLVLSCTGHGQLVSNKPVWTVELKTYGWKPAKTQPNRAFFKGGDLEKLEAIDDNTHLVFLSDSRIAVFHTKTEGVDWQTAPRELEAFFVNASDGTLAGKKQWSTILRGSESGLIDSESRLFPLTSGRFLAVASRTMLLYDENSKLLNQKRLEPSGSGDLWSVQVVDDGRKIFLRHQSAVKQQTSYQWLDGDALRPFAEMPGPSGLNFSAVVRAGNNFILTALPLPSRGITEVNLDGSTKLTCSEPICRDDHAEAVSSKSVIISGRRGIGVVDLDRGLLWSRENPVAPSLNEFQFGDISTASSADMFSVWITSTGKRKFDGVSVSQIPTIFVYRVGTGKLVFTIPLKAKSGHFDFALSPDGRSLAVFDGAAASVYSIPSEPPKN